MINTLSIIFEVLFIISMNNYFIISKKFFYYKYKKIVLKLKSINFGWQDTFVKIFNRPRRVVIKNHFKLYYNYIYLQKKIINSEKFILCYDYTQKEKF